MIFVKKLKDNEINRIILHFHNNSTKVKKSNILKIQVLSKNYKLNKKLFLALKSINNNNWIWIWKYKIKNIKKQLNIWNNI